MSDPVSSLTTWVYAHRGASATHPENSLAAFEEALRLGVQGIELDVRATSDGVPVVIHDGGLQRTFGVDRFIADLTAAELRSIAPQVPRLDEVVALVGMSCHLNIEIKVSDIEVETLAALEGLEHGRWAISSFDWDVLHRVRQLDRTAELWVLCFAVTAAAVSAVVALGATTIAVEAGSITPGVVRRVGALGRRVMAWTVNSPVHVARLTEWGVTAICTDDPGAIPRHD